MRKPTLKQKILKYSSLDKPNRWSRLGIADWGTAETLNSGADLADYEDQNHS